MTSDARTGVIIAVVVIVFIFLLVVIRRSLVLIRPFQRGLHERFGRLIEVMEAGFYFFPRVIPFIDTVLLMDLRENYVEIPEARVITRDNVVLEVDAIIFYQIVKPQQAFYDIRGLDQAIVNLAEPGLRNTIGTFTVDEALSSREIINTRLRDEMDKYTDKWGTRVTKVEVKRIDPPRDIQEAMHRQKTAEQMRRAVVLEAEGKREALINVAEGDKRSSILRAEGEMTARMRVADGEKYYRVQVAEGQAEALNRVLTSIHGAKADPEVISYLYVTEALPKIFASPANKWILGFDLANLLAKGGDVVPAALSGLLGYQFGQEGAKPAGGASGKQGPPGPEK